MNFYIGFEKRAFNISDARKATKNLSWVRHKAPYDLGFFARSPTGNIYAKGSFPKELNKFYKEDLKLIRDIPKTQQELKNMAPIKELPSPSLFSILKYKLTGKGLNISERYEQIKKHINKEFDLKNKLIEGEGAKNTVGINKLRADMFKKVTAPEDKEITNRLVLMHEKWEGNNGRAMFHGHKDPSVILKENNAISTLPAQSSSVKDAWKTLRAPEQESLQKMIPGFEYGKTRLNRHDIKRVMHKWKSGFEKRSEQVGNPLIGQTKNIRSGLSAYEKGGQIQAPEGPKPGVSIAPSFKPNPLPTYQQHTPKAATKAVLPPKKGVI